MWKTIHSALEADILSGRLAAGDRLPTEPELAKKFGVGRHSVRRAVADLAKEGKLRVEQGRGTFVEGEPVLTYAIGKRTRLRKNLLTQGCDVTGDLLGFDVIKAEGRVREALRLAKNAMVSESRRITYADDTPIAFGAAYHAVDRFPGFVERRDALGSVSEAYRSYGVEDYVRGETNVHARPARDEEAAVLRQHVDLPVMVVEAVDTLLDGTPISFSRVVWSAARVRFTMAGD